MSKEKLLEGMPISPSIKQSLGMPEFINENKRYDREFDEVEKFRNELDKQTSDRID